MLFSIQNWAFLATATRKYSRITMYMNLAFLHQVALHLQPDPSHFAVLSAYANRPPLQYDFKVSKTPGPTWASAERQGFSHEFNLFPVQCATYNMSSEHCMQRLWMASWV